MGDRTKGLCGKYSVIRRSDGTDGPGGKHEDCTLFVLDITHDIHAIPALRAYADSCAVDGYGPLAEDLRRLADDADVVRISFAAVQRAKLETEIYAIDRLLDRRMTLDGLTRIQKIALALRVCEETDPKGEIARKYVAPGATHREEV